MLGKVWGFLDAALFGSILALHRANEEVKCKLANDSVDHYLNDRRLQHSQHVLNAALDASIERLQRIENKAMSTLLGIGVAIAVLGASSDLLGSGGALADRIALLRFIAAGLTLLAMIFLLGSGLLALSAYRIGEVYRPTLGERVPVVKAPLEAAKTLYSIEQNDRAATLRSNRLVASFAFLRNGLTIVVVVGLVAGIARIPGPLRHLRAQEQAQSASGSVGGAPENAAPRDSSSRDSGKAGR